MHTCCLQQRPTTARIRQHTSAYVSVCTPVACSYVPLLPAVRKGLDANWHAPAAYVSVYVSIRQHTSAYVRKGLDANWHAPAAYVSVYVSIRQHTSAYASIRQHTPAFASIRQHTSAYVSTRQHTPAYAIAYVCIRQHTCANWHAPLAARLVARIRQHTSAYVSIRQHTSAYVSIRTTGCTPCGSPRELACSTCIRQHTSNSHSALLRLY
jgi:hypothetical protein